MVWAKVLSCISLAVQVPCSKLLPGFALTLCPASCRSSGGGVLRLSPPTPVCPCPHPSGFRMWVLPEGSGAFAFALASLAHTTDSWGREGGGGHTVHDM